MYWSRCDSVRELLLFFFPSGFLLETDDGLNAQICAVHADFICDDGRLNYGLLPY